MGKLTANGSKHKNNYIKYCTLQDYGRFKSVKCPVHLKCISGVLPRQTDNIPHHCRTMNVINYMVCCEPNLMFIGNIKVWKKKHSAQWLEI
jgi:hypothetical protein